MIGIIVWFCWRRRRAGDANSAAPVPKWTQLDSEKGFVGTGSAQSPQEFLEASDALSSRSGPSVSRSASPESRAPTPFWPAVQEVTDWREQRSGDNTTEGYVKNPPYTASSLESMTPSLNSFGSVLAEMPRNRAQGSQEPSGPPPGLGSQMGEARGFDPTASNPFNGDDMSDISSFSMSPNATPTLSKFPTRQSALPPMSPVPFGPPPRPPRPPRPARSGSLADSLASIEIENILEMAKLYSPETTTASLPVLVPMPGVADASSRGAPDMSPAALSPTAGPPTPRSLNTLLTTPYMGQNAPSSRPLPTPNPSSTLTPISTAQLRPFSPANTYRVPPQAPLPLSPLPAGSGFSPGGLGVGMRRSAIISVAGSEYGGFSEETLEAFQLLRPPTMMTPGGSRRTSSI